VSIVQVASDVSMTSVSLRADVPIVYIVDDDIAEREALESLIASVGWETRAFSSASEFLACPRPTVPRCLILDVSLPDLDGLVLQECVAADRGETAVIFVTAHVDVATVVRAMKGGAIHFFTKPCRADSLLAALDDAIEQSRAALVRGTVARVIRARYESLSGRERQVLTLVVTWTHRWPPTIRGLSWQPAIPAVDGFA
jgi:FixJ family two-component response regulator